MNKKGMGIITLIITTGIVFGAMMFCINILERNNLISELEQESKDMDLLNLQQLANMAYSNIYFENLREGIRRELTANEIRDRMIKNGVGNIDINQYMITVKNGDVYVMQRGEK